MLTSKYNAVLAIMNSQQLPLLAKPAQQSASDREGDHGSLPLLNCCKLRFWKRRETYYSTVYPLVSLPGSNRKPQTKVILIALVKLCGT